MKVVIDMQKVSFSYQDIEVVNAVSLQIFAGEFFGIIGPNAGGKTTLLKLMLGLLKPTYGQISLLGHMPHTGCTKTSYVPQHIPFAKDFPISVFDTVLMGRLKNNAVCYSKADKDITIQTIETLDIKNITHQKIGALSGGQLQRVLLARALVSKPEILFLDEPTANIDSYSEADVFNLLKEYNQHITIVIISHDIGFISSYVNRIACMNKTLNIHKIDVIDGPILEKLYGGSVKMIDHHND